MSPPRFYCPLPLAPGALLALPAAAVRHVQVLRLQPGDSITLFSGEPPGGEFAAQVERMGRHSVQVRVGAHRVLEREAKRRVHLAVGVPAQARMDGLVEKATELGAASLQPLLTERSVLRLDGARARQKTAHWQSVAVAACEQCGGNQIPPVGALMSLATWLHNHKPQAHEARWLLSLRPNARPLHAALAAASQSAAGGAGAGSTDGANNVYTLLSGPEGGLSPQEEEAAIAQGWLPVSLGPRVLRADTAPLAALAALLI